MSRLVVFPSLSWIVLLHIVIIVKQSSCEFGFSSQNAFELTVNDKYPTTGREVTLKCRRKRDANTVTVGTSLLGSEDNILSWEENDRTVLTTNINDRGGCTVIIDSRYTTGSTFDSGQNRLSDTSCEYDGSERAVKLKIKNWTPAHLSGDRWRCLQFPFAESRVVEILSFVPVTSVSIQQDIDRFNTPSRGTIVTCITSPSRPASEVYWFIENDDGSQVKVTMQADLKENVETDFNGLSVTTSSVLFSHDDDHGTNVFCKTVNRRRNSPIPSDVLPVRVKYAPTVEIHADPGASILEDTDVTLHCVVRGRPIPSLQWIHRGHDSSDADQTQDNFMIISLDPYLVLSSVTLRDSGKYECVASNGIGEEVTAPIFLFVREKPASDEQNSNDNDMYSNEEEDGDDDQSSASDKYSSAIVGSVITIIVIIVIASVMAFLYIRKRWGKDHNIVGHRPRHSLNSSNDGQAIYATCSSVPGNSELPPYVDVLPPSYKLSNITNPGYEVVDNIIGCMHHSVSPRSKRPLPSTPPPSSDYGYEEIREEMGCRKCRSTMRHLPSSTTTIPTRSATLHNGYTNTSDDGSRYINANEGSRKRVGTCTNCNGINSSIVISNGNGAKEGAETTGNSNSYVNTNNCGGVMHDNNITTITTGGGSDGSRVKSLNGSDEVADVDGDDGITNGDRDDDISNDNNEKSSNNSETLKVRTLRQEYGGYEVPVLPPLEK